MPSECNIDSMIGQMTEYLRRNGQATMGNVLKKECVSEKVRRQTEQNFKYTLQYLLEECEHEAIVKRTAPRVDYPILTLFTTWEYSPAKYFVHTNIIKNWGSFTGKIKPILFTNDSEYDQIAKSHGWTIRPVTKFIADGIPILKDMYKEALSIYNTTYYAFSNGDILFEDGLISTLEEVGVFLNSSDPVMMVGQRTNAKYITAQEAASSATIKRTALQRGELFQTNAEDYFIVNRAFPWDSVPGIVVGRRAYDNWLTAHTICWNITLIDVTDSIIGLHQTTEAGNLEGHSHANGNYNVKLLEGMKLSKIIDIGYTNCSPWRTYFTHCGHVKVVKRENRDEKCKCIQS